MKLLKQLLYARPCGKYFVRRKDRLLLLELDIQVSCNQVVQIRKDKVVEGGDIEEVVVILNIQGYSWILSY